MVSETTSTRHWIEHHRPDRTLLGLDDRKARGRLVQPVARCSTGLPPEVKETRDCAGDRWAVSLAELSQESRFEFADLAFGVVAGEINPRQCFGVHPDEGGQVQRGDALFWPSTIVGVEFEPFGFQDLSRSRWSSGSVQWKFGLIRPSRLRTRCPFGTVAELAMRTPTGRG